MIDTYPSLFYGYTALWLILVVYVYALLKRMRRLERRFELKSEED